MHGSQWFHIEKNKLKFSTANPAQFGWKLAGLAVLFSRQLLNGSQDFFFRFNIFILFFKYETIETHARAFLVLNISAVGSVKGVREQDLTLRPNAFWSPIWMFEKYQRWIRDRTTCCFCCDSWKFEISVIDCTTKWTRGSTFDSPLRKNYIGCNLHWANLKKDFKIKK